MTTQRKGKPPAITILEPTYNEIVIAETGDLQPFLKTFRYAPENASQESLGTILGVFEIGDRSESSAYIVNFLVSVIKKEYFSQPRRTVVESLEATLHKINRALAELIKQGNTEWLGTLHAAIGIIDKGMLHFSVTGDGTVALLRNGILSNISEGLAPEEASLHPLKTFIEVSTGRLQQQDLLFFASPELFTLLSSEDIERASKHFPADKLSQFIHTALINQSPLAGLFILSFKEITPVPKTKQVLMRNTPKETSINNVFSQSAFRNKTQEARAQAPSILTGNQETSQSNEYTDGTTGHIYVQGETIRELPPRQKYQEQIHFITQEFFEWLRVVLRKFWFFLRQNWIALLHSSRLFFQTLWQLTRHFSQIAARFTQQQFKKIPARHQKETPSEQYTQSYEVTTNEIIATNNIIIETSTEYKETRTSLAEENERPASQWSWKKPEMENPIDSPSENQIQNKDRSRIQQFFDTVRVIFTEKLLPLLRKIALFLLQIVRMAQQAFLTFWRKLTSKQKAIILTLAILLLVIGSWLSWRSSYTPVVTPEQPVINTPPPAPVETNLSTIEPTSVWQHPDTKNIFAWKDPLLMTIGVQEISILNTETLETNSYVLPNGNGTILQAAYLSDIQMIVLLTDTGSVISFTPANHAFSNNNLSFKNPKDISAFAGYSTYLYTFDTSTQAILRYPRADGGFGTPVSWLHEAPAFQTPTSFAVNTNILIPNGQQLFIYTKGKRNTTVTFENSASSIHFDRIVGGNDTTPYIVLDRSFGRIIMFDTAGHIQHQYATPNLRQATDLVFDTTNNQVFFSTPAGVQHFDVK
ncbi:MAG: hypothetical protein WCG84_00465 [Candidatus Moraniibacteriota bacterium]